MEDAHKNKEVSNVVSGFRSNRRLHGMIAVYIGFWTFMAVSPYNRFDWLLENLLIWLTLLLLIISYRRFTFTNRSYLMIAIFLSLHTLGAHYSYAIEPLDRALKVIFGFHRDNYDRIVHFSFGLLLAYPVREFTSRVMQTKAGWAYIHSAVSILAAGAFYELIEMWVAQIVAPDIGSMFLGSQGDPWDAQHDIEAALYGAIISMCITYLTGKCTASSKLNDDVAQ
jgi:putative membrane protein